MRIEKRMFGRLPRLVLGLVAALVLVLGLCPAVALAGEVEVEPEPEGNLEPVAVAQGGELAAQADGVRYIGADGTTKTADGVQALTSLETAATWGGEGTTWYVAGDGASSIEIQFTERVTVMGDVHLILADNAALKATKGITVSEGNSLTIYAQSEGENMGKLVATGGGATGGGDVRIFAAGIGGFTKRDYSISEDIVTVCGALTVNGGSVTATGGDGAAGIGGGAAGAGGTVTVNGGTVTAEGGFLAAGIGGGNADGGIVNVTGGTVTATGGDWAAGIGGGNTGACGTVNITGGTVTAMGKGGNAAGIGRGDTGGAGGTVSIGAGLSVEAGASKDDYSFVSVASYCASDGKNHNDYPYARIHPVTYKVSVAASPAEGGTVQASAQEAVKGAKVALEAERADGYEFDGWTLDPSDTGATIDRPGSATATLTVGAADVTAVANFKKAAESATYKVTVAGGIQNGTVSVDKAEAAEGDTVKVTAKAAEGYELDTVTVRAADGKQVKTRDGSFTMPASDVTVSATFTKKDVAVPDASVTAHVQRIGWMDPVTDGTAAGTTGKSRRMEALTLKLPDGVAGGIEYRGHVQRSGWEKTWAADGNVAGTTGKSRRVEAVQIQLTGEAKDAYDVYYRVHVQRLGWMGWAKNGEEAGTQGMSRRAEAIQVVLVRKDAPAPDATYKGVTQQYAKAFVKK